MRPIKKSVNLPAELLKEVEKVCELEDRNFSQLVRRAIHEYLKKHLGVEK